MLEYSEKKISKMHEDKKEAPSLIIPKSLLSFSKSTAYKQFLFSIYEYSFAFN